MAYKDPEVQRTYAREWIAARRAAWFADKVCAHCGATGQLELDHIDPSQKVSSAVWSWSAARRGVELAKCQALCHACHRLKTTQEARKRNAARVGLTAKHGTYYRYYRLKCGCSECKAARIEKDRRYRARRRLREPGWVGGGPGIHKPGARRAP